MKTNFRALCNSGIGKVTFLPAYLNNPGGKKKTMGAVFAFSPVGLPRDWQVPTMLAGSQLPMTYLLIGSRAGTKVLWKFFKRTEVMLRKAGVVTHCKLVGGGTHSYSMWGRELVHALRW